MIMPTVNTTIVMRMCDQRYLTHLQSTLRTCNIANLTHLKALRTYAGQEVLGDDSAVVACDWIETQPFRQVARAEK